jgi:undecaprenyl-diphosphatase
MVETLVHIDQTIFHWINCVAANPVFDLVLPWIRNPYFWIPAYAIIVFFMFKVYGKKGVYPLLFILIGLGISDFTSASIIKPWVERIRPCNNPSLPFMVNSLVPCGSGYSFVSAHATNHFFMAIFLIHVFAKPSNMHWLKPTLIFWAIWVCYAQIYVGVHYPADVIGGGILGILLGILFGRLHTYVQCTRCGKPI